MEMISNFETSETDNYRDIALLEDAQRSTQTVAKKIGWEKDLVKLCGEKCATAPSSPAEKATGRAAASKGSLAIKKNTETKSSSSQKASKPSPRRRAATSAKPASSSPCHVKNSGQK